MAVVLQSELMDTGQQRAQALGHAITWANIAGRNVGKGTATDVVEAADLFLGFLTGQGGPELANAGLESLIQSITPADWDDEKWQRDVLEALTELVWRSLRPTAHPAVPALERCKSVEVLDEFARAFVEDTRDKWVAWPALNTAAIDSLVSTRDAFEIGRTIQVEWSVSDYDDRLRADPSRLWALVEKAVGQAGEQLNTVIDSLVDARPAEDSVARASFTVADIHVALWAPVRAKIDTDESGEHLNFTGSFSAGAAAVSYDRAAASG